jgi:hypothetical protein
MKASIINKISSYVFIALMIASAAILGMFFFVGYDNYTTLNNSSVSDPQFTDLLMYWMYALVVFGVAIVVLFVIIRFLASLKTNPRRAMNGVIGIALIAALFGAAYSLASDEPIRTAGGGVFDVKSDLILSDIVIYVQYVLIAVSVIFTVIGGSFKFFNKVKA